MEANLTLNQLKALAIAGGYSIEVSADGREERLVRPDGTVAIIARKPKNDAATGEVR